MDDKQKIYKDIESFFEKYNHNNALLFCQDHNLNSRHIFKGQLGELHMVTFVARKMRTPKITTPRFNKNFVLKIPKVTTPKFTSPTTRTKKLYSYTARELKAFLLWLTKNEDQYEQNIKNLK